MKSKFLLIAVTIATFTSATNAFADEQDLDRYKSVVAGCLVGGAVGTFASGFTSEFKNAGRAMAIGCGAGVAVVIGGIAAANAAEVQSSEQLDRLNDAEPVQHNAVEQE